MSLKRAGVLKEEDPEIQARLLDSLKLIRVSSPG